MRWKRLLIGVMGLIVAALVVVYILVTRYDFNSLKPQLVQAVKERTGRELTLGGDMTVRFGLTPALVMENVSLQNAPWGSRPELVTMKRFELQVALLPLLRGEMALKRLRLVEPDILIETDKSGQSNVVFVTSKPAAQTTPKVPPQGDVTLPALTVNQIQIDNGRLTYTDGRTGKTHTVALEYLRAAGSGPQDAVTVALQGTYNERPLKVEGTVGPLMALATPGKPWPLTMRVAMGEATVTVDGTFQDVLHARGLSMAITAQGPSIATIAQLADMRNIPELGPFRVSFTVTDAGGTIAVQQLEVEVGNADLARLTLAGAIQNVLAQQGIEVRFTLQGKDLGSLQQFTGTPFPLAGPFAISGQAADIGSKAYRLSQLQATFPNMDVSGTAEVHLAGARPQLTARLSSEQVDLRPSLSPVPGPGRQQTRATAPATKRDKVFSQEPLSLGVLQLANATLEIYARQLLTPRLALDDLTLRLVLHDGHLIVQPLQARMGGGSLDGSVQLQPRGQTTQVVLAVKMDQVDVGRIAKELQVKDILEGKLAATIAVQGQGDSVAAIMAGLNGKTAVVLGKGRLDDMYIELLGADLGASLFRLVNPRKQWQQVTEINCLVSRFDVRDGIAQSAALVLDTRNMSVVGEGQVNLKTEALDISLKPAPKEGAGVSDIGKVGLSLSELARPFKLGGTLAHPSLAVDMRQAALTVGKSVGGTLLFGPAGIATALLSGNRGGPENACVQAIEAAKAGVKPTGTKSLEGLKDHVEKTTEGLGTRLKKLFDR